MNSAIVIVGAGGHAAVVADALLASGEHVLGFTDVDASRHGQRLCGLPVLGGDSVLDAMAPATMRLANGIGGVRGEPLRRSVQRRLEQGGWRFVQVRHPSAVVSRFAEIGPGAQLLAACVVQAGASIGEGCIVNTAAIVEHDVFLGEYVHVAPRAVICGTAKVGAMSHIGAGAVLRQGLQVERGTIVGAGAVVVRDIREAGLWLGVPARPVED